MKSDRPSSDINRRVLLSSMALLPALSVMPVPATAQQVSRPGDSGFSFAAVGDTRPMMYLPLKEGQPDLSKFFVEMFGLVMPEKTAEAVVARDELLVCSVSVVNCCCETSVESSTNSDGAGFGRDSLARSDGPLFERLELGLERDNVDF